MVDAYNDETLWTSRDDAQAFNKAYAALPDASPGRASVADWGAAASLLLPLLRGSSASQFELPNSMGAMAGSLPGYHSGFTPIPESDPECSLPACPK